MEESADIRVRVAVKTPQGKPQPRLHQFAQVRAASSFLEFSTRASAIMCEMHAQGVGHFLGESESRMCRMLLASLNAAKSRQNFEFVSAAEIIRRTERD